MQKSKQTSAKRKGLLSLAFSSSVTSVVKFYCLIKAETVVQKWH